MEPKPRKRDQPSNPPSDGDPRDTTGHQPSSGKKPRGIKASARTPLLALRKKSVSSLRNKAPTKKATSQHQKIESELDYSNFGLFREYLTNEYLRKGFIQPQAVLELASIFIRCLLSVKRDEQYLRRLRGFHTNSRKFHLQLIAALGWIYADSYSSALPGNKSKIQSLSALAEKDRSKYDCAMELVRILLKCAKKTYAIAENEVRAAKIGGWFNNRISQIKKGVWSADQRMAEREQDEKPVEGLYLPFYLVLRAIHPNCSLVSANALVRITLAEVWQLVLEPRLYAQELHHICAGVEVKLLPRDTRGNNYNLWFLYDCLQPEPFWCESMDHYFSRYVPDFKERKMWHGMQTDEQQSEPCDRPEEITHFCAEISRMVADTPFPFDTEEASSAESKLSSQCR